MVLIEIRMLSSFSNHIYLSYVYIAQIYVVLFQIWMPLSSFSEKHKDHVLWICSSFIKGYGCPLPNGTPSGCSTCAEVQPIISSPIHIMGRTSKVHSNPICIAGAIMCESLMIACVCVNVMYTYGYVWLKRTPLWCMLVSFISLVSKWPVNKVHLFPPF